MRFNVIGKYSVIKDLPKVLVKVKIPISNDIILNDKSSPSFNFVDILTKQPKTVDIPECNSETRYAYDCGDKWFIDITIRYPFEQLSEKGFLELPSEYLELV